MSNPEFWMERALDLAHHAHTKHDEVPVGAIIVYENQIIGSGFNYSITSSDPTAHAEIIALREAAKNLKNYRLTNCKMYVTLEPCPMCAGALVHARIDELFFAARDTRTGAVCSILNILDNTNLNHRVKWQEGFLAEQSSQLLKQFFKDKR